MALSSKELQAELEAIVKDCYKKGDTLFVTHVPKGEKSDAFSSICGDATLIGKVIYEIVANGLEESADEKASYFSCMLIDAIAGALLNNTEIAREVATGIIKKLDEMDKRCDS